MSRLFPVQMVLSAKLVMGTAWRQYSTNDGIGQRRVVVSGCVSRGHRWAGGRMYGLAQLSITTIYEGVAMKVRTMRTFDELEAFYKVIRDEYPDYTCPRLSAAHYGVFDVGENARGWAEGQLLVAGAAINVACWDVFEPGGQDTVLFEHLMVKPESRNRGIGSRLLNFIVESHCDLTIQGRVSRDSEWERLVPWYESFSFQVTYDGGSEIFMERVPDEDGEVVGPALREEAANWRYGESRVGLDLDRFVPELDV